MLITSCLIGYRTIWCCANRCPFLVWDSKVNKCAFFFTLHCWFWLLKIALSWKRSVQISRLLCFRLFGRIADSHTEGGWSFWLWSTLWWRIISPVAFAYGHAFLGDILRCLSAKTPSRLLFNLIIWFWNKAWFLERFLISWCSECSSNRSNNLNRSLRWSEVLSILRIIKVALLGLSNVLWITNTCIINKWEFIWIGHCWSTSYSIPWRTVSSHYIRTRSKGISF